MWVLPAVNQPLRRFLLTLVTVGGLLVPQFGLNQTADAADAPLILQAEDLIQQGQTRQANALLLAGLKKPHQARLRPSDHIRAYQLLANIAIENQQYQAGQGYLAKALTLNPSHPQTVTQQAYLWATQANDPYVTPPHPTAAYRAAELFTQAQKLLKTDADKHHWQKQFQVFQQSEAYKKLPATTQVQLSETPIQISNTSDGLLTQLQALVLNPKTPEPVLRNTAYPVMLQQLETKPNHSGYLSLLSHYFGRLHQPSHAIATGLAALQTRESAWPSLQTHLAKQYQAIGDTVNATRMYEAVLQVSPHHEDTLLALGKLSQQQGNMALADSYFDQAIQQNPTILAGMLTRAQQALRQENTRAAAQQFEEVLARSHQKYPGITASALHGLANTWLMDAFYQQPPTLLSPLAVRLMNDRGHDDPLIKNDHLKINWAKENGQHQGLGTKLSSELAANLQHQTLHANPMVAGEAHFMLGNYVAANRLFDEVDGQTVEGYRDLGDRLLALHALNSASILYQRGRAIMAPPAVLADLEVGQALVTQKRQLAQQRIDDGNDAYNASQLSEALKHYHDAQVLFPDWDVVYLRLGDTYLAQKNKHQAHQAYKEATTLNPAYLENKRLAKTIQKLAKYVAKHPRPKAL